ncbi:hypothetical protein [Bradyrhizobium cenepequi]|uniref:hypothetical protein n=1 Tax=Bradyrhizobium cenepequi TaxID=2821403 RepID=UPI001CE24F1F|nr:hypothetical protein [Bradyrhizobium cenepequi]MCA6107944.1 hypothetical protein [Bradyrhizobium cenepequi]
MSIPVQRFVVHSAVHGGLVHLMEPPNEFEKKFCVPVDEVTQFLREALNKPGVFSKPGAGGDRSVSHRVSFTEPL